MSAPVSPSTARPVTPPVAEPAKAPEDVRIDMSAADSIVPHPDTKKEEKTSKSCKFCSWIASTRIYRFFAGIASGVAGGVRGFCSWIANKCSFSKKENQAPV